MINRCMIRGSVMSLFVPGLLFAATIFQDDFSNPDQSKNQWKDEFNNLNETFAAGSLSLGADKTFGLWTHSVPCSTFTYSARVKPSTDSFQVVGLLVCGGRGTTYYRGYLFTIKSGQQYTIYKMTPARIEPVYQTWHSFVRQGENILTVSKAGSHLVFFANGVFLKGITDTSYNKGDIGFCVDQGQSLQIDDVRLTDQFIEGKDVRYFTDRFDDPRLPGWNLADAGAAWSSQIRANVGGGLLSLTGTDSASATIMYTEGAYKKSPMRVRARHKAGGDSLYYGLMMIQIEKTFATNNVGIGISGNSGFVISNGREYGSFSKGFWIPQVSDVVHGKGQWDTLELTPDLEFRVNGNTVLKYNEQIFDYNAVGLYVSNGLTVEFDDFVAGDSTNSAVAFGPKIRPRTASRPAVAAGRLYAITDLLGRSAAGARQGRTATGVFVHRTGGRDGMAEGPATMLPMPR